MRQGELRRNSYEICYDPEAGTALVYRYVRGGICGPMTGRRAVEDRQGAEAEALQHDLMRTGRGSPPATATSTPKRRRSRPHLVLEQH